MAILSTGPIDNSPVMGSNPAQMLSVRIVNVDPVNYATIQIQGYILNDARTLYASELFVILPNQVMTRQYVTNGTGFEFIFVTGGPGADQSEISVWGKTASGELVDSQRLVVSELLGSE